MAAIIFVDTNVPAYSRDASEPEKQKKAMVWMDYLWRTRAGRLSFQVLQEFYVTVTAKLDPGLDRESARKPYP
jgi:predicted nucleic acid-binding protein